MADAELVEKVSGGTGAPRFHVLVALTYGCHGFP